MRLMNEWNIPEPRHEGTLEDLNSQLTSYYGPRLPEQPLPPEAWYILSARLSRQQTPRRAFKYLRPPRIRFRRYSRYTPVPAYIQEAFERIAYEAHQSFMPFMLRCTYNDRTRIPYTRVSGGKTRAIHLVLPASPLVALESAELNLLLASGLACHLLLCEQKRAFVFARLLVVCACLIALLWLLLFGERHLALMIFPIAILGIMLVVAHRKGRKFAFRVDALTVQWLGRSQVCEGLHALLKRSRHPRRKGIGQVSMMERIQRVCGTPVPVESERLTLAR